MTEETLQKANKIKKELLEIDGFLYSAKNNYNIKVFNKLFKKRDIKNISVVISDYMRPYQYFELNKELRQKFIALLQEEYDKENKEFEDLF